MRRPTLPTRRPRPPGAVRNQAVRQRMECPRPMRQRPLRETRLRQRPLRETRLRQRPMRQTRLRQRPMRQRSMRQTGYYDPESQSFVLIDTCFSTHHLQFAEDPNDTLYFSGGFGPVVGWLDTKVYDETGDERIAQAWCPQVIDTNGERVSNRSVSWDRVAAGSDGHLYVESRSTALPSGVADGLWVAGGILLGGTTGFLAMRGRRHEKKNNGSEEDERKTQG